LEEKSSLRCSNGESPLIAGRRGAAHGTGLDLPEVDITPRESIMNALLRSGYDEGAADHALPAVRQWLLWRAEELRAEGLHADATWYARVANEIAACLRPVPPEAPADAEAC
jgi:hypothetical protein